MLYGTPKCSDRKEGLLRESRNPKQSKSRQSFFVVLGGIFQAATAGL